MNTHTCSNNLDCRNRTNNLEWCTCSLMKAKVTPCCVQYHRRSRRSSRSSSCRTNHFSKRSNSVLRLLCFGYVTLYGCGHPNSLMLLTIAAMLERFMGHHPETLPDHPTNHCYVYEYIMYLVQVPSSCTCIFTWLMCSCVCYTIFGSRVERELLRRLNAYLKRSVMFCQ